MSYHTKTFDSIPFGKRERVFAAAAKILGRDGVAGARMADIAKEAGISHGSLFAYFPSKDDLVRAVVQRGIELQRQGFDAAEGESVSLYDGNEAVRIFSAVLREAWDAGRASPELVSLWLSFSSIENQRFADDLLPLEEESQARWIRLASAAVSETPRLRGRDPRVLAFLLDGVSSLLMRSRASDLERRKLRKAFGDDADADDFPELLAREIAAIVGLERPISE